MAKIVAIANQKGGVGKTTTAVNLSSCVAALGKRVLIVDLDPQGNTTTGYGIPKRSVEKGTYEILIGEARASEAIRKTEYRTDVIGSNTRLAGASLEMIDLPARESRLRKALAEVQKDYDFIFIDCPPSLDLLTLNGLSACDSVLIPVQCEYYALEGLSELISTLKTIRKKYNPYLDIEGVVFTMFSLRYNLTVQVVEQAAQIIADNQLNVRQAEALCKKLAKPAKEPREPQPRGTLPVEVEESLKQVLGSEVNVAYHDGKGKLTVHFYSDEQLRAFANLLGQYQNEE